MDIPAILEHHYPGKQWDLNGDAYAGLVWKDRSAKPTEAELRALWTDTQSRITKLADLRAEEEKQRAEADTIGMKAATIEQRIKSGENIDPVAEMRK